MKRAAHPEAELLKPSHRVPVIAKLSGNSDRTIRNWIYAGKIGAIQINGGPWLIPDDEARRILRAQT
jgi:predicted site-specific integrase-resolvase